MKIALLGPSSTGKTFLAKKLEELLEIPYLAYETRVWMKELGFDCVKSDGRRPRPRLGIK